MSNKSKATTTLDSEELSTIRGLLKNGNVSGDGRICVAEVAACMEAMEYIVDGPPEDFVRTVVPAAAMADKLSLGDAIKVVSAAKAQVKGSAAPPEPSFGREDSLAELQSSFNQQVVSGEITAEMVEVEPREPPPPPGIGREDSLAQLESSFRQQVLAGNIPAAIMEGPEGSDRDPERAPPPNTVSVGLDIPMRRRSVAGTPSPPSVLLRNMSQRAGSVSAIHGAQPVAMDDFPKRRSSVTRPRGGSSVGLQAESGRGVGPGGGDSHPTPPDTPSLRKQRSEMELLDTASNLGVKPVEASPVPKKRRSFTVSKGWLEAAAEESARALEAKRHAEAQEAEAQRQRVEAEKARVEAERARAEAKKAWEEVGACLSHLTDEVVHRSEIARAREEAERSARAAALEVERAEAAAARTEVKAVLWRLVDSLERDAVVAAAREEAERLMKREAEAREAAEIKAAEAAERAEEAAKARQEEDRIKDEARRALQEEAELLRSKLQEAGEEAAERAQEEAQARAQAEANELRKAEELAEREARLAAEAERLALREAEAREATDRVAKDWEEKFQALQREREEEARRAKEELARAVEEAREFEKAKVLALRPAEDRKHSLAEASVSYEVVNDRTKQNWWGCIVCSPDEPVGKSVVGSGADSRSSELAASDDGGDDAAVGGLDMKPEMWIKSSGNTASTKSMDRPGKSDVCSIS